MAPARDLAYFDPRTLSDPYRFYAAHRDDGPVVDVSTAERETYLVIGFEAVAEVVRRPDLFSSRPIGAQGVNHYPKAEEYLKAEGFGRVPHVIVMDPPRHTAHRAVLTKLLRDKRLHQMRPQIRVVAEGLVDGFAPAGQCEFVRDYAWKLSVLVIADLLGIDRARIDDFKRWSDAWVRPLLQPLSEDEMMECMRQIAQLQHYLVGEIELRKAAPRADLLSDIAHATLDRGDGEQPLRRHEQLALCEALIIAGNDTTAGALSLGMLRLVQYPQVAARVRADPSLVERFAEESLRFESAVQSNFRCLTADTEFHGMRMNKGALVLVSWGAANRDPSQFPDPARFDIDRPAFRTHHGFGGGIHACAGAALARQELVESYALLLRRLDNLRLPPGVSLAEVQRTGGIVSHGLARLPIHFDVIGR